MQITHKRSIKTANFSDMNLVEEYIKIKEEIDRFDKFDKFDNEKKIIVDNSNDETTNINRNSRRGTATKSLDLNLIFETYIGKKEKILDIKQNSMIGRIQADHKKDIGADKNKKPKLHEAIDSNDINKVDELLKDIQYYNEVDKYGRTALHYACSSDNKIEILCSLLTAAQKTDDNKIIICNRNIKDIYGRTPFIVASMSKCTKVFKILCDDINIDKNAQDN